MKQLKISRLMLAALLISVLLMGVLNQSVMAQTELVRDDFTHAPLALGWPLSEPCQVGAGLEWQGNGGAPQVAYNGSGELEIPQGGADRAQFATTIPGSGLALPVTDTITFVCIFNMPAGGHMSIGIHEGDNGGAGWGPSPGGATSTRMFLIDGLTKQINFSDDGNSPGSGGDIGTALTPDSAQGLMFHVDIASGNISLFHQDGADPSPTSTSWNVASGGPTTGFVSSGAGDIEVGFYHDGINGTSTPLLVDYVALIHNLSLVPVEVSGFLVD